MRIGFDVAQTCVEKAGCGWVAALLAKALAEVATGDELSLYHHFGDWLNADTSRGVRLSAQNVREPFREMSIDAARELWTAVASGARELPGNPEIVHANSYRAPKVGSAKLVYTIYDVSFWAYPEYTTEENRLICQKGTLEALFRAAALVFISQSSRDDFEKLFPGLCDRRKILSTVALLASRFPHASGPRRGIDSGGWLAVGSLEPRKNYDILLDALERYWERSKMQRSLTIAGGSGWKSEEITRRIRELEQRGLVHYEGYVSEAKLQQLYQESFALIFPSHYEGFGLPVVEAMSQGCPVITRHNSSLEEVGGSAAIYYDDTVEDLFQWMLKLENSSNFYPDCSLSSLTQASKFDWRVTARHVLELYKRILKSCL
jgi:glycosyltransferase involved in cell wall biosynthesis